MPEYTPEQFAAVLLKAAAATPVEARSVTEDSARNLRGNARANATAANPVHARQLPASINYDVGPPALVVTAEVGYDKRGQGNLGAILEYANGRTHNAPQRNLGRAADVEEPRFTSAVANMGERLLE